MAELDPIAPLHGVLRSLSALLDRSGIAYTFVGGVAVSLLARPRFTRDADVLVTLPESRWESFLEAAALDGFAISRENTLEFAATSRVFLLTHLESGYDVDIMLALLPIEEDIVRRSRAKVVDGIPLRIPTPEDLVIMKSVAGRPIDRADIENLIEAHPGMDRAGVLRAVAILADTMKDPRVLEDIKQAFDRAP